jgi:hypothetical protein
MSSRDDPNFLMMTISDFIQHFGEIHILLGYEQSIHNTHHIKHLITDYVNNDNRFYI